MQLFSRKYIGAQCIFLLCVCLAVEIGEVASDPLKIVNFTYRTKQLGLIDQTITSNIISLELDQEVFHQVQCPIEFSEANRTTFVPCCATNSNVTGCYEPLADGYIRDCIDGNGATNITISGTKTPESYQRYSFKVSNYATCHSISILTKAITGQVFLAVSIRPQFRSASLSVNDFLRVEYGSNGLSLCCSRIRELNPAWTGEVYIGWEAFVTTQFEFLVSTDPLLPVSEFYMLPPVEIQCDGLKFTAHECRERSGCFPTPAADDPMFSLMKAIGGLEPYVANPNRFATGVTIRKDQFVNARISNVAFPFPESRFSDSSCIFTFPTLANNKSEVLGNAVGLPFVNDIPCDPVAFNETLTNFRNRITELGNASPRMYQETNEYFFRALFWVTSDAWTSCTDLVDEQLVRSLLKEVTVEDSNMCIETNISDAYLNDPCCNPILQRTECCASRDVSGMVAGFEVASDAVANTCETPRCVTNLLNDYITLSASTGDRRTGCAIRTTQAIGTGLNVIDDLQGCIRAVNVTYCNSDAYCTGVDAASVCLPSGYCSIPCKTNAECATQVCEVVQGTARNITSCKFIDFTDVENLSSEIIMSTAWRCVEINVDPFSVLFVKQDLGMNATSSRDEIVQKLVQSGGLPACFGANDDVPTEECNNVRACNWAVCNSLTDPYCNIDNCTDPNLGSDHFCGACQSGFCAEVSTFPHCEYQNSATASDCAAVGGSFNGLKYQSIVSQKCIRPTTSQSQCFPPQFCATSTCGSKCYSSSRTSSDCTSTSTNNVPLNWQTWTVGGQNYSLCVTTTSYTDRALCTGADSELSWWPGTKWIGGQLNTESQCQLLGLCSGTPTLKAICDNTKICTDGYSKNEQDCEVNGGCNDFNGCVFDWDPVDFSCGQSLDWTPLGCYSYIVSDPDMCASQGGRWLTRAASRAECQSKAIVCREPKLAAVYNAVPPGRSVMPPEISLKNQSECVACDGVPVSYFSWTGGQWVPATFQPFEWRQRDFVRSNLYVAIPSYDYFETVLSASLARRYAKSLESDLWCRFGQFSESVSNLVCDCAARGSDCFSGVSSSVVGVGLVCSNIQTNVSSDAAVIRTGDDFLIQGDDCINVRTSVMPMSQFAAKQVSSLSAAAVSSVKSQQRRSVLFIRNDAGIVVGQVISDGVKVDRDPQEFTGTLEVCLTFPTTFQAELQVAEYRWAVPNDDFTQFNLLDTAVNPGDVSCFTMVNVSQVYFPVGLQQSWQTADFVSTLFAGEIFFLVMGMVWYFAIFAFTGYHFVLHIMLRVPDAPFFNLSTTALLISMIFLINRFIYMVLILSGAMDQNPQVEVVFSSFPALLFYVVYSIIVIRWAEIYHFTMTAGAKRGISRLRPAIIALNVILVAAFVLLIVLYFALQDYKPVIYSCATPEDQLTEKSVGDIVSIVYKAFFAAVSAVLSALFVIYGVRVLMLMRAATQKSTKTLDQKKSRESAFQRLMAVSSVCTVALLAQAIFLLWSSVTATNQDEGRFYGILTFLYLTEMPPAIIFVIMFKKASAFVKGSRNSMTTRQTASQTDQNSLQVGSATEEAGESQN